jgi:hypothetical protein
MTICCNSADILLANLEAVMISNLSQASKWCFQILVTLASSTEALYLLLLRPLSLSLDLIGSKRLRLCSPAWIAR